MRDELVEPETAQAPTEQKRLLDVLDGVQRLHVAHDEQSFLAAAAELFSIILGSAPHFIRIAHAAGVLRRLGSRASDESVLPLMHRASAEGLPVFDSHPPGGLAIPIRSFGDRFTAAVYVAHRDAVRASGAGLEILKLAAAQIAIASLNLERERAAAAAAAAAKRAEQHGVSLHDAKLAFERDLLQLRLDEAGGNVAKAARSLDMDRGQLSRLMKKHKLQRASFKRAIPEHPEESGSPDSSRK